MDKIGTPLSMEEVYINETDLVENVKTDRNLHDKGRRNDFGGTDEAGSVLFEEIKTKGNLIEKRQVVMFEVTDESQSSKQLDVAADLSIEDTASVLELDSNAVKNFEEKEDEVSRLLFALRALCTSDNTDVVLLCGAWQMRAHSQVEKFDSKPIADNTLLPGAAGSVSHTWRVAWKHHRPVNQVYHQAAPQHGPWRSWHCCQLYVF